MRYGDLIVSNCISIPWVELLVDISFVVLMIDGRFVKLCNMERGSNASSGNDAGGGLMETFR